VTEYGVRDPDGAGINLWGVDTSNGDYWVLDEPVLLYPLFWRGSVEAMIAFHSQLKKRLAFWRNESDGTTSSYAEVAECLASAIRMCSPGTIQLKAAAERLHGAASSFMVWASRSPAIPTHVKPREDEAFVPWVTRVAGLPVQYDGLDRERKACILAAPAGCREILRLEAADAVSVDAVISAWDLLETTLPSLARLLARLSWSSPNEIAPENLLDEQPERSECCCEAPPTIH
jgi:hypothetical protein